MCENNISYLPENYYLDFWEAENSVLMVSASCIPEQEQAVVGEDCDVVIMRKSYSGWLAARGMCPSLCNVYRPLLYKVAITFTDLVIRSYLVYICSRYRCMYVCLFSLGSKIEMERLESLFLNGDYNPLKPNSTVLPTSTPSSPPPSAVSSSTGTSVVANKENTATK